MTSLVFRETLMTHLLLWGNAYLQIIRNGRNEVIGLYPLMPNKMTVMRSEYGEIFYKYNHKHDDVYLSKEDVLHIPGLGFDGLIGYSPTTMAKNTIRMAMACKIKGHLSFKKELNLVVL